ncbi:hypothetical protein ACH42_09905 [Endozoicomonas sp. (ex Bugula neritina AB1)]|nr:hypothetical protein ACH42_09905 [Endozoicomonas sp. (ex Bugula neritina AB1)]
MQLRIISLLSILHIYRNNIDFQLGTIYALTCDRIIPTSEYESYGDMTFLNISQHLGAAWVQTTEDGSELLTETTAFKGIIYSIEQFCKSREFYEKRKFTLEGYHPSRPVSFLNKDSYESVLYGREEKGFKLKEAFIDAACDFTENSPHLFFETKQIMRGIDQIERPTTKKTVKKWLDYKGELFCKNEKQCEFLGISNAPNIYYQHLALLQGLEESILTPVKMKYQLATAGAAVSEEIPMAYAFDSLTKMLYMEEKHPPE